MTIRSSSEGKSSVSNGWEYHDGKPVVGRLVPASGGGGVCDRCGGVLDTRESGVCVCFSGVRGGESGISEGELTRVWTKYRNRLWGTDFMGPDEFRMAVKELLGR